MIRIFLPIFFALSFSCLGQTSQEFWDSGTKKEIQGDLYGAIADYSRAINIDPENASVLKARGLAKYNLKDYYGAIADFTKILNMSDFYAKSESWMQAYFFRANSKFALKDYRGAISDFNKSIEYDPKNANSYLYRGASYDVLDDMKNACLDWSMAGELGNQQAYGLIQKHCQ